MAYPRTELLTSSRPDTWDDPRVPDPHSVLSVLDGCRFWSSAQFEATVQEVCNQHIEDLPVAFTYDDAYDALLHSGWLRRGPKNSVIVVVPRS